MTNPFLPGGDGGRPDERLAALLRQLGIPVGADGEIDLNTLMQQVQSRLSGMAAAQPEGSGVNWERTKQLARQVTATKGSDPTPTSADQRAVADAGRLADLWLDKACTFPVLTSQPVAWSRAEWLENTMAAWRRVTEPIAVSMADALGALLQNQASDLPPELAGFGNLMSPMLHQFAGTMYSMQLANALGEVSAEILTGTEIGLQLLPTPRTVVLPQAVRTFGEGLDVTEEDLLLYLVLREDARQRLFAAVGWLAPQLLALVKHYAREIRIDTTAFEEAIDLDDATSITPEKMMELSEQLQGKLFAPTRTEEQDAVLQRLETLLALVEGWVDDVVGQAASQWMPAQDRLFEIIRRRRGTGGPSETVFKALVGLEIRPRRVREAAALWQSLREERGVEGRDAVWAHPDVIPDADALDHPDTYLHPAEPAEELDALDQELRKLLDGGDTDSSSD